jgi:hypothetical protein
MTTNSDVLIKLCGLWENQTKDGRQYFSGVLGGVKVLLFRDKNPAEGGPQWSLMIAPRPPKDATTNATQAKPQYPQHRHATPRARVDADLDDEIGF